MEDELERLKLDCTENGRVCPMPMHWNDLWELLPNRHQLSGGGWEPPLPLIRAAWSEMSDAAKRERLCDHLDWAAKHGAFEAAGALIGSLREEGWLHIGE